MVGVFCCYIFLQDYYLIKKYMIVIDKSKSIQNIILTLTESTSIQNAKYLMVLKSDATRDVYKIFLPANISVSTIRYDLFEMNTTDFDRMIAGYYSFSIYQQGFDSTIEDEKLLGEAIEVGKLLVRAASVPVENEYIIYKD